MTSADKERILDRLKQAEGIISCLYSSIEAEGRRGPHFHTAFAAADILHDAIQLLEDLPEIYTNKGENDNG